MHGWVDRWSVCGFTLLSALVVAPSLASGCGGAAGDSLSDPGGTAVDAGSSPKSTSEDAASTLPGPTSPAATVDATAVDANPEADDAAEADGSGGLDAPAPAGEDAAPHDAGLDADLCGATCGGATRCCMTRGALYFGQCYSPALCAGCCF
jgi:hypothetical protein